MKRILCIMLIVLNVMAFGCNQKPVDNKEKVTTESETKTNIDSLKKDSNQNKVIEIDKPFEVNTEHGSYNFMIKSVTKTDWWQRSKKNTEKTVILLNIECENMDFNNKDNTNYEGLMLYNAFTVKDENNYMLDHFSMSFDDVNMGSTPIPQNTKGKIYMPFVAENDISKVTITFNRGGTTSEIPVTE